MVCYNVLIYIFKNIWIDYIFLKVRIIHVLIMLKNGIHFPIAFDSKNKLFASLRKSSKEMACKLHNKIVCGHVIKFHWGMERAMNYVIFLGLII